MQFIYKAGNTKLNNKKVIVDTQWNPVLLPRNGKKNPPLRISVTALKPFQINLQFKNRVLAIQTQLQGKLLFPPHLNSSPSTIYIEIVSLPLLKAQVRISITGRGWVRSAVTRKMFRTRGMGEPERDRVTSMGGTKTCSQ